ncbi:MAG: M24 family metallopeptidase, partial [Spirochaetota bacterium]
MPKPQANPQANFQANPQAALTLLRQKMQEKQLDYYLVGSSDPHNDEYLPPHWCYLEEVSGFSGSLGYLLVAPNFAGIWVDARYHIQADRECPDSIQVFHIGKPGVPQIHEYWRDCLMASPKQMRLGFDGACFSRHNLSKLLPVTASFGGVMDGESLLTEDLWASSRPPLPESPVYSYGLEYCGQSRQDKIIQVREMMDSYDYYPVFLLDSIAWLLNIRADDIAYNPVAISYLLLGKQSLSWYIDESRIQAELACELRADIPELEIKPYSHFYSDCRALVSQQKASRFLLSERCNMRLLGIFPAQAPQCKSKRLEQGVEPWVSGRDIITDLKAIKNPTEQEQLARIMAIDGAAQVVFQNWLRSGEDLPEPLDEYKLGQKIVEVRRQVAAELGKGESFAPIVGFGENSALPHYSAAAEGSRSISRKGGWLLIDSGGQYLGGTTDMTRCFSLETDSAAPRFDSPNSSAELSLIYTLVLRGHLRLQNIRFPKGTLGVQLDTIARSPLWYEGLNYQHGTGHGVGSFLNVHEGPASISPYPLNEPLKAGMLVSNEPGYYREGSFGLRIENLLLVQVDKQNPNWLCFEVMT